VAAAAPRECGYVQVGAGYEAQTADLVVLVWAAEGLSTVESAGDVALPRPYAAGRLVVYG